MGMFRDGLKVHNRRLMDSAGVQVDYRRGDYSIPLIATLGSSDWQEQSTSGGELYQELKSVDFIVDPGELKIGEQSIEPSRGDYIIHDGEKYVVIQTNNGTFWSWSDGFKTFYRIHTSKA